MTTLTLGHFTFWISLFAKWNCYVYSQAARNKFILIIVDIYMSSNSGGASYGAKGLKPPPPDFAQAPPDFCIK